MFGNVTSILGSPPSLNYSGGKTFIRMNIFHLQGHMGIGLTPKPLTGTPPLGWGGTLSLSLIKQRVPKWGQCCSRPNAVWLERTDKRLGGWAWRPSWPKIPSLEFGRHHILPTRLTVIPKLWDRLGFNKVLKWWGSSAHSGWGSSALGWNICKTVSSLMKVRNFSPWRSLNATLFCPCNTRTCDGAKCREAAELCVHAPLRRSVWKGHLLKDASSKI